MEGSSTRTFPRMLLDKRVELDIGPDTVWIENPANNLSIGGLFICRNDLPLGAPVHIRISGRLPFEANGEIRNHEPPGKGVGIVFTSVSERNRDALNDLIEDLTLRGLPAA